MDKLLSDSLSVSYDHSIHLTHVVHVLIKSSTSIPSTSFHRSKSCIQKRQSGQIFTIKSKCTLLCVFLSRYQWPCLRSVYSYDFFAALKQTGLYAAIVLYCIALYCIGLDWIGLDSLLTKSCRFKITDSKHIF